MRMAVYHIHTQGTWLALSDASELGQGNTDQRMTKRKGRTKCWNLELPPEEMISAKEISPGKGLAKEAVHYFPYEGCGTHRNLLSFSFWHSPQGNKDSPIATYLPSFFLEKATISFFFSLLSQSLCHFPIWLAPESESIFLIFSQGFDTTTQHMHYHATSQGTPSLFLSPAQISNNKKHWGHPTSKKEEQTMGKEQAGESMLMYMSMQGGSK